MPTAAKIKQPLLAAALLGALAAPLLAQAEVRYSVQVITDMGANMGNTALAANGDIAGAAASDTVPYYQNSIFFYTAATRHVATFSASGWHLSSGEMNDNGVLVGTMRNQAGTTRGFVYDHGAVNYLADGTTANDINNAGVIAGSAGNKAATFANGTATLLSNSSGSAGAINNSGTVAGSIGDNGFVSQNGSINIISAGAVNHPMPFALSSDGALAGADRIDDGNGEPSAWMKVNGQLTYIPGLHKFSGGYALNEALGINALHQVVGYGLTADYTSHGFLYENGQTFDLNSLVDPSLKLEIFSAGGIDDRGQIVATACESLFSYSCSVIKLTPLSAVPEPETYALFMAGLGAVGLAARRRRQRAVVSTLA